MAFRRPDLEKRRCDLRVNEYAAYSRRQLFANAAIRGLARRRVAVRRSVCARCARPTCKRGGIRQARDPVADLSVKKHRLAVLRARECAIATA